MDSTIENKLSILKKKFDFNDEQIKEIKFHIIDYAVCAVLDSEIRQEALNTIAYDFGSS